MAQQAVFSVDKRLPGKLPYKVAPTKLDGVYINPALPDGLDINKATQDELRNYGFLVPKPTKDSPAHLQRFWNCLATAKWESKNLVEPEFEVRPGQTHHLKDAPVKKSDTNYVDAVWSGAGTKTGTWTGVAGSWTIPYVSAPPEVQGTEGGWNSASWVGIDGFFTSNDVLQAGIEQRVSASGVASYIPWYEWFAPAVSGSPPYIWQTNITAFTVQPGQTMYCYVEYIDSNTAGYIFLYNETTGKYVGLTLQPPPGATFNASSCEWIMEAPDGGEPVSSLPYFTPVIFTSSFGWGPSTSIVPQSCDTLNIENASGKVLTYTTTNSDTLTVSFTG